MGVKYFLPDKQQQFSKKNKKIRVTILTQGGLKAMEELAKLEVERGNPSYASGGGSGVEMTGGKTGRIASNEMCTFLILNISSLQLIPVNMIAYRQQYSIFISCHYFFPDDFLIPGMFQRISNDQVLMEFFHA